MTLEQTIQAKGILIPKRIHLREIPDKLEFEYSWFNFKYLIAGILAPVMTWFLVNSPYINGSAQEPTFSVAIVVVICMFIIYYTFAKIVNTTRIIVASDKIRVLHGPIPLLQNLSIKKEDIAQLYVTRHHIFHYYYRVFPTYQVNVILKNKRVVTLISKLESAGQGRFIEQKIEYFFNIEDVPVEGEIDKGKGQQEK